MKAQMIEDIIKKKELCSILGEKEQNEEIYNWITACINNPV